MLADGQTKIESATPLEVAPISEQAKLLWVLSYWWHSWDNSNYRRSGGLIRTRRWESQKLASGQFRFMMNLRQMKSWQPADVDADSDAHFDVTKPTEINRDSEQTESDSRVELQWSCFKLKLAYRNFHFCAGIRFELLTDSNRDSGEP